ncbi:hypothetical protein FN846DRAFT_372594 [Sphaerosporella brunnea]|uniref:ABM domain-containing protein n=1 Tax=Sphaerosporella brunnea TaxID=1250544 RepID=A0A5J5EIV3_9PEZI|nr:hypothetical protein FN846DRAFT_372594 [Sphaerosporella brunnea]
MPVTEIVRLLALPPNTPTTAPLLPLLSRAITTLNAASSDPPFRVYRSISTPQRLYFFGQWDSPEHHAEFIRSPENQGLLAAADGILQVEEMVHVDVPIASLALEQGGRVWVGQKSVGGKGEGWYGIVEREGWVKLASAAEGEGEWEELEDFYPILDL